MSTFKIILWSNSDYCRIAKDIEECAWSVMVDADSKYDAVEKVIRPYILNKKKSTMHDDHPKVYEIIEIKAKNSI